MSPITVDQSQINEINAGFGTAGVRLPFPVLYLRWKNGKAELANLKNAQHFGGWEVGTDQVDEYLAMTGKTGVPHGFTSITATSKEGGQYGAYITRWIGFAPVGQRKRWRKNEQGSRSHTQILGLLADYDPKKKTYEAWGNAVLTATGLSAQAIEDAMQRFSASTAVARQQFAPGVPAYFFWHPIGTFGEIQTKMVGKGSNKSPITPCQVHLPDVITEDLLTRFFVGEATVQLMVSIKRQAESWLSAESWKKSEEEGEGEGEDVGPDNFPSGFDKQGTGYHGEDDFPF